MKKIFQKIWYTFSVILIIAGMILVLPGAMYGGDNESQQTTTATTDTTSTTAPADTTTTTAPVVTTTSSLAPANTTSTTASAETTTTIAPADTTSTTASTETSVTSTTTTTSADTTTTTASNSANTQDKGSVTLTRISNGAAIVAIFYLKDTDGKYYSSTGMVVSRDDVLAKQALTSDGSFIWTDLHWKTYKIEVDPISEYISTINLDTFTIDANNKIQLVTLNITSSSQETTTPTVTTTATASSETSASSTTTLLTDTTPPVIVLTGDAVINLKIGETFTDPGVTATDNNDTTVTVTTTGSVDTNKTGSYTLSYDATDAAGNTADTVTRTVNVAELTDITPPVIVLNGDAVINLKIGDTFTDPGAIATDNKDASVTVTTTDTVDTSKIGSYTISYDATDATGNAAVTVTRTVNVTELIDTTPPLIVLNGDAVINLKIGDTFTDPGATATDNKGANVAVTTTGTVNTNFASSYTISYNATDTAGNIAATVIRTVNVTSLATVVTDKPDYMPTDYVLVTGSGWLPGETVKLDFHETLIDLFQQTITYYTVADSAGNIRDIQYLIELRHLGASFVLTATGVTSGLTSQTVFTDSRTATNFYLYVTYNTGAATNTQGFQASTNPGSAIHFDVTRSGGLVTSAIVTDGSGGSTVATWTGNGSEHNNQENVSSAYWHWIWNGNVLTISDSSTITPNYGSVTVIKKVDGEVPNTGASFSFYYTVDGGEPIPFTLSSANNWTHSFSVLVNHPYVLVENDPGPGWNLPMITKISGSIVFDIDESTRTVTFTPHCEGTLVFNNTHEDLGSIVVDKSVANGLTDGVFTFTISKVGVTGWSYSGTPVVI
ncbi:MAG: immunoglobulin-like domain-containing protein, partial [Candidatus Humimicrobiaceae bacterium]